MLYIAKAHSYDFYNLEIKADINITEATQRIVIQSPSYILIANILYKVKFCLEASFKNHMIVTKKICLCRI